MNYYKINLADPISFCSVGKSKIDHPWKHYERVIGEHILYLVVHGELYMEVEGVQYTFRPGDVFIMEAGAHHVGWKESSPTFYWMHFTTQQPFETLSQEQALQYQADKPNRRAVLIPQQFTLTDFKSVLVPINQLIHHFRSDPRHLMNDYLATFLLLELSSLMTIPDTADQKKNRRFDEIVVYIDAHSREELKIADIAAKFNYSEKYLSKLFRTHYHMTIKEFIIERRLKLAETLLLSSNDSIATIAKDAGFHDEYYFMRLFKKKVGLTPSHYRNAYYMQILTQYENG